MYRLVTAVFLGSLVAGAAAAQGDGPARPQGRRGAGFPRQPGDSGRPDRAQLEERVRVQFGRVLRNQLGLNDAQVEKVGEINQRYAGQRRTLLDQEREVRIALRQAVTAGDSANQQDVAGLLDRMMASQRKRMEIVEQEQRDLAGVLTPLQRAKYLGLEEQLRQRIEGMGQGGGRMGGPNGPNGPPPNRLRGGRRGPPPDSGAAPPRRPPVSP